MNLQPGSTRAWLRETFDGPRTCDACDHDCADGHNVPDRHFHCCRCHQESVRKFGPRDYVVELCELCQRRTI